MSTVAIRCDTLRAKTTLALEYFEQLRIGKVLQTKEIIIKRLNSSWIHRICKFFGFVGDYTVDMIPDSGWGLGMSDDITLTFAYLYKSDEIATLNLLYNASNPELSGYANSVEVDVEDLYLLEYHL